NSLQHFLVMVGHLHAPNRKVFFFDCQSALATSWRRSSGSQRMTDLPGATIPDMRLFTSFEFWRTLLLGVDYREDASFQKAVKAAEEYSPSRPKDQEAWELLLEFAHRKYDQAVADYTRLDDKRDAFMKFAATLAGV